MHSYKICSTQTVQFHWRLTTLTGIIIPFPSNLTDVLGYPTDGISIWDPAYYMCYTYQPSTNQTTILGWSEIFYIDTFEDNDLSSFVLDLRNLHATGLRVAIHSPGTLPNMKKGHDDLNQVRRQLSH